MSAITPDSYIKLVRFDVTPEHQITFSDGVSQIDYLKNQLEGIVLEASSYQRKDFKVRFPVLIDTIEKYNYMIVQNLPYNYKYFFYYITDMEYVNDEMTDVYIKLDVFQTYQFEFQYNKSYIEREHVNSDNVGENTIPEGIEKGEFILNKKESVSDFERIVYVVQVKKTFEDGNIASSTNLGGIQGKGAYYVCRFYKNVIEVLNHYLNEDEGTTIDDVETIYMIPYNYTNFNINPSLIDDSDGWIIQIGVIYGMMNNPNTITKAINKPTTIDGYNPINKKLLTKEFNYLVVSNQNRCY